jgi:LPPG:FO 2-phospho-L-lactate transferase
VHALKITALAGGVGAARFLTGLAKVTAPENLTVIVNTGDDINLFSLHISPDVDIITYTLAGIVDESQGWGIKDDTFHALANLKALGVDTWFNIGDRDLATHIYRTNRLLQGATLAEVTDEVRTKLGLKTRILPMSNDHFETKIITPMGTLHFEEYFVKHQCKPKFLGVEFDGEASAKPAPGVLDAVLDADLVIVCPSNPIVSVGTILSIAGVRDALRRSKARIVAVSPIVAGQTIKGPADKMLSGLGVEVSAFGVAELYSDFIDAIVIDNKDADQKTRIEKLGLAVTITDTVMRSFDAKAALAKTVTQA